jgi:hypothetical protein
MKHPGAFQYFLKLGLHQFRPNSVIKKAAFLRTEKMSQESEKMS